MDCFGKPVHCLKAADERLGHMQQVRRQGNSICALARFPCISELVGQHFDEEHRHSSMYRGFGHLGARAGTCFMVWLLFVHFSVTQLLSEAHWVEPGIVFCEGGFQHVTGEFWSWPAERVVCAVHRLLRGLYGGLRVHLQWPRWSLYGWATLFTFLSQA